MGYSSIAIGLGLGGGKSATSNGRSNVAKETFTTATLSTTDSYALSVNNTYTLTVRPSTAISAGDSISIVGLTGSTTSDNGSLTVAGTNAAVFGSSGAWTQSSGTLVLTVANGQSIPTGSDTVITFVLANPSSVTGGVSSVTLTSIGFSTSSLTGTFLKGVATYNVTTRDTEANILVTTPSNPSGEVTNAYGTDTNDLYVYDGSAWYIYNNYNNYSVSFDGTDDYVDCGVISGLQGSSNGAISVWIKPDTAGHAPNIGYRPTADHQFVLTFVGGILYFGVRNGSTTNIYTTTAMPNDTNWHHYVATFSSGTVKIYIDGSEVSGTQTSTNPSTISSTSGSFFIGRNGADNKYTDGLLDEASLFNTALSASDVTDIYNGGVPKDISSLNPLGWWRMGDNNGGTGTTITDKGNGGNNGTLRNSPTFSTNVP